ncbi:MAG: DoxX family membrane protein [Chloroflexi bacterium]|nr:DoxX family membrane protein [Chloroflexota bacterium]
MAEFNPQLQKAVKERFGIDLDRIDRRITHWMAEHGIPFLRVSVGIVFFWFGALKLVPGLSPAEGLIIETLAPLSPVPMNVFIPILAVWEMVIGLGYITGRFMRLTILLMFLQMIGTVSPLFLNPGAVWNVFPFALTLEGQYIIKNLVLISAALVVGATVRGGRLTEKPAE